MKNRGLGKGLSALLREEVAVSYNNDDIVKFVNIDQIEVGNYQPRKKFEYDRIKELADSILINGVLQPIIVTQGLGGRYIIVAGERRWRACKVADVKEMPIIVKDLTNKEILEIALVENIQREGLSVVEEAEGFERLIQEFGYTQEQLSQMLGKSRSHIANLLRLNHLPQVIKDQVNEGKLTMGHARCLIGHEQAEVIANYIIENELNVRQTEIIVKDWSKREYVKIPHAQKRVKALQNGEGSYDNDLQLIARSLSDKFGIKITIEDHSIGGKLTFHYNNLEQLDAILSRLS